MESQSEEEVLQSSLNSDKPTCWHSYASSSTFQLSVVVLMNGSGDKTEKVYRV